MCIGGCSVRLRLEAVMPKLVFDGQAAERPRTCFCDAENAGAEEIRIRLSSRSILACFCFAAVADQSAAMLVRLKEPREGEFLAGGV